ncbi:MAG: zinc-binding dehydrogenase [Vicinamibacterales bacterium]
MTEPIPTRGLQLRSLVRASGDLELSLEEVPVPSPGAGEVLVRIQATPINPSDIGLLFGAADMKSAVQSGTAARPVITAKIPEAGLRAMAARVGQSLPVGNEGAGLVVAAGPSPEAEALLGRTVALLGGAMYAQYRVIRADQCLPLPPDVTAVEGASCFVNPLTVLGFIETMRREGHKAIAHTAAASNLGQMLVRLCAKDGIPLVNIVRRPEQAALLRSIGATRVCDSSAATFADDLTNALAVTGATLAFDATGGGRLAAQILTSMEAAITRSSGHVGRYGSSVHKQVYIYGRLDPTPLELTGSFGMAWGVGGWLVFPFLEKAGADTVARLKARVVSELTTTFASHYAKTISLPEALTIDAIAAYTRRATGEKHLIAPDRVGL